MVHATDEYFDEGSKQVKAVNDLDFGLDIPCTHLTDNDIIRRLKDKEEEAYDLNERLEKMRLEFENYKKQNPVKAPVEEVEIKPEVKLLKKQKKKAAKLVFF